MKKKTIIILSIFLFILGLSLCYLLIKGPKCPDDFATVEESTEAMSLWTNKFFNKHRKASIKDWGDARLQYYYDNNCKEAIERRNRYQSGNVSEKEMKFIDQAIDTL